MKQPVRYFAIGLLTASMILLAVFYFEESKASVDDLSADEMIEALKADGYRVVTEAEYITLSVQDEQVEKKGRDEVKEEKADSEAEEKDKSDKDKDKDDKKAKTYTINIKSGMLPSEISEILAENDIIKDAFKFDQFLEKNDYSKYIQLGKHKVNSEMSEREVAEALTK